MSSLEFVFLFFLHFINMADFPDGDQKNTFFLFSLFSSLFSLLSSPIFYTCCYPPKHVFVSSFFINALLQPGDRGGFFTDLYLLTLLTFLLLFPLFFFFCLVFWIRLVRDDSGIWRLWANTWLIDGKTAR